MIGDQHRGTLGQFFQANLMARDQREAGSGTVWLVDFWLKGAAEQREEIASWTDAQRDAVRVQVDEHLAALDALGASARQGSELAVVRDAADVQEAVVLP